MSLLIGDLAFESNDGVKIAVLTGSLASALVAAVILRMRARVHRRIHEAEIADSDHDGIPDAYERAALARPGGSEHVVDMTEVEALQPVDHEAGLLDGRDGVPGRAAPTGGQ